MLVFKNKNKRRICCRLTAFPQFGNALSIIALKLRVGITFSLVAVNWILV